MHMADALISPAVGGAMWAASAGLIAWCARTVRQLRDDRLIPLMGVLGAFIFTAQMINFSIPLTGSSGHLGGGLILAVLLGPHAAFLVMASVLAVQGLFFADGGLLALGCNIFNLGFFPAFIAFPVIYQPLLRWLGANRPVVPTLLAAIVGLQLGALGVVLETFLSGRSELPLGTFLVVMQPIHLAIGVVEGLVTVVLVTFLARARPEALLAARGPLFSVRRPIWPVLVGLLAMAILLGGVAAWYASTDPDGLEWAVAKVTGREALAAPQEGVHSGVAKVQEKTALLPEYGFKGQDPGRAGTSVSGLVGGMITLALVGLIGYGLKKKER